MAASTVSPRSGSPVTVASTQDASPTSKPMDSAPASRPAGSEDEAKRPAPFAQLVLPPPSVSNVGSCDGRKPSIQIKAHSVMTGHPKLPRPSEQRRRLSSPPPPPVFRFRVAFDTFEKLDKKDEPGAEPPSFTLTLKHKDYEYTKRSRTFLCGLDSNDYSEYALEWLIDELVDDGDEIVCLRVLDPEIAKDRIPEARYREEAESILKQVEKKNHENKAVSIVMEFSIGKTEKVIRKMIEFYEPAILIVGTRGRSLGGIQGLLPGSISKFCLQNSPVPVIVVRPNMQRARGKRKRLDDPARQGYRELLDRAGIEGHVLDEKNRSSTDRFGGRDEERPASADESAAVAAALGMKSPTNTLSSASATGRGSPLVKVESAATDFTVTDSEPDGVRLLKSPEMQGVDSPEMSGESAFGDDEEPGAANADEVEAEKKGQVITDEQLKEEAGGTGETGEAGETRGTGGTAETIRTADTGGTEEAGHAGDAGKHAKAEQQAEAAEQKGA